MAAKTDFLESVIDSDRYQTGNILGRGCWGVVYEGIDQITGEEVAVKVMDPIDIALEQMAQRNLDPVTAMKKEAGKLAALSNIVPRKIEMDESGRYFLVMPKYNRFLNDILKDHADRAYLGHGLKMKQVQRHLADIANGLHEVHTKLGRIHGDIKPDNLAVDNSGGILINDLGTSTCPSMDASVSPRDNMGFAYTRAPELFDKGSHPERKSDVWAFGALAYRMFSGKYPFEEEINNAIDPASHFRTIEPEVLDFILKKRVNRCIPRQYRKIVRKCLASTDKRYGSIEEIGRELATKTKPGFLGYLFSRPKLASTILIGCLGLTTLQGWTYRELKSQSVESRKYQVISQWDHEGLGITNNLFDADIEVYGKSLLKDFYPEKPFVSCGLDSNLEILAKPRLIAKKAWSNDAPDAVLAGNIYVQGKDPLPIQISLSKEGTKYHYRVPRDLEVGTHSLIVEFYSPQENSEGLRFASPGQAIHQKSIPLVVGSPDEKVTFSSFASGFSGVSFNVDHMGTPTDPKDMLYRVAIHEEGYSSLPQTFLSSASILSFALPIVKDHSPRILEISAEYHGNVISRAYLPIRIKKLDDIRHVWELSPPDQGFAAKLADRYSKTRS